MWGIVALVPLLALALAPGVKEGLDLFNRVEAHEAVNPGPDGWVSYSGARIRLAELVPTTDLKRYNGEPFQIPAGTRIWRATITFDAPKADAVSGCFISLEDREGRTFGSTPEELAGAKLPYPGCTPDDENTPSPFQTVAVFLLPETATPAAVRVTRPTEMPRYARLTAG